MSKGARADIRQTSNAEIKARELASAERPQEYPFAYAIIEGPPGQWSAVCLDGVTARELQRLEPNGDAEPMFRATQRLVRAIEMRTIGKRWGKP